MFPDGGSTLAFTVSCMHMLLCFVLKALEGAADDEDAAAAVPGGPVSGSYASEQAALKAAFLAAADEADAALQEGGLVARKAAAAAAAAPRDDPASGQHKEKDMNKVPYNLEKCDAVIVCSQWLLCFMHDA